MKSTFKNIIPNWLKAAIRKAKETMINSFVYRTNGNRGRNFIVTFHKCGSQWFRTVFESPTMHDAVDFQFHTYKLLPSKGFDDRPLTQRSIPKGLKAGIYGPIYMAPKGILTTLNDVDRVAVVIRDPRNVIVSWYDSILKTHAKMGNIAELRSEMKANDEIYGIDLMITHAKNFGTFEAMESWVETIGTDPRLRIYRFEDVFSAHQQQEFMDLLNHFKLTFDTDKVSKSLAENSFSSLASKNQHYKQGNNRKWNERLTTEQIDLINSLCPKTIAFYDERR